MALTAAPVAADTLRDALEAAYASNPNLTAARAGQQVIDENVPLAKSQGRPRASATTTYNENILNSASGQGFSTARSVSVGPTIQVPLYSGGAVKNAVRAAEIRVEAGRENLRGTESSIFSAVVGAYMDVIRDEAVVSLNRAQVGVLQVNLQATRDRFEIGDLTRTDVAQSEARLATAISSMESARANLIRSKEGYIQLVGKAPEDLEAPPPLPNLPEAPEMAVKIAIENNPDLAAANKQYNAAIFDRQGANATRLPTVSGFTSGNYNNALGSSTLNGRSAGIDQSSTSAQIGVQVNIPLYQGGAPAAQIRQAQARLSQAQEAIIAAERDVIAQTHALSYIGQFEDGVVRAEEAYALAPNNGLAAFAVGVTSTLLDKSEQAMRHLDIADNLMPGSYVRVYVLGWHANALARAGRWAECEAMWEKCLLVDPHFMQGHLQMSILYWRDGRRDKAAARMRMIKEVGIDNAMATLWVRRLYMNSSLVDEFLGIFDEVWAATDMSVEA